MHDSFAWKTAVELTICAGGTGVLFASAGAVAVATAAAAGTEGSAVFAAAFGTAARLSTGVAAARVAAGVAAARVAAGVAAAPGVAATQGSALAFLGFVAFGQTFNGGNWKRVEGPNDIFEFKSKASRIKPGENFEHDSFGITNRVVSILDSKGQLWNGICWHGQHYEFRPIYAILGPLGSIFSEAIEMLSESNLIYMFYDLHNLAKRGNLQSTINVEAPMSGEDLIECIKDNKGALVQSGNYIAQDIDDEVMNFQHLNGSIAAPRLASFGDEEIVNAISVNDAKKRITVTFKGSTTLMDWRHCLFFAKHDVQNPVHGQMSILDLEQPTMIGLHAGFHDYLCRSDNYGRIIAKVKILLGENQGYSLYTTGHSLGGALATLFGFFAASDQDICSLTNESPVYVVSIGSPRVGNFQFRQAFRALETSRRLRHLRIVNGDDIFPCLPNTPIYMHCGINLRLMKNRHEIRYSECNGDAKVTMNLGKCNENHSCKEYQARLVTFKEALVGKTIDDLYRKYFRD